MELEHEFKCDECVAETIGKYALWQQAEIERLQGIVDKQQHELGLRISKRKDCLVCGKDVPFDGAIYCSFECAIVADTEEK